MTMAGNVWVAAESWKGTISDASHESLALGRSLADALGVRLEAILLGHGSRGLAASLAPADATLYVDHPTLADASGVQASRAIAALPPHGARCILVPATTAAGTCLALPARLHAPLINFCRAVEVLDGALQAHALLYGGKMTVTVAAGPGPVILGILPGAATAVPHPGASAPTVEQVAVDLPSDPGVRLLEYEEPDAGDVDVTQQEVLIGVGRHQQRGEPRREDLADTLGGAVCGSRPVIDQGWLPLVRQVGKSGVTVKPRLYVAAGISGAPEHLEGMRDAEVIIAVNTDAGAPIFSVAHYGIVDDATDVLEALAEAVRKRKG
jgi:electron transfer flavoprotein alpha subunit